MEKKKNLQLLNYRLKNSFFVLNKIDLKPQDFF